MSVSVRTKDEVIDYVQHNNVFITELWFTDVLGRIKSFGIPPGQLEEAFEEGLGFDGSSVEGFARIYESDLIARPIPSTFQVFPWETSGAQKGRMICEVLNPDGTPYAGSVRHVLRSVLEKAAARGYTFHVGPELEFFYFHRPDSTDLLDNAGYFDLIPYDVGSEIRQETVSALQSMGIEVEAAHHEVAPSQHEIDLRHCEALLMADQMITYRFLVKEVARRRGFFATFMPKPLFGENGSGMHVHMSLSKDGKNAFYDRSGPQHLSTAGRGFLAGILRHSREMLAITNQWVNSYKRLVPGFEAPVYVSWGQRNRSALVRVPMYKPGKQNATRCEYRCPDPACNPYLTLAVLLAAGLKGIEEGYELPAPVEEDIYRMSEAERRERGIESLPGSLMESIRCMEESSLMRETLGEHVFTKLIENKRIEWENYRALVTPYELERYLPIL